jgi:MinD superfamily P-loop ATPase
MEKVAVTGGKGGVGKSTIGCLLANSYLAQGKKVLLVDLDVECPNDYLLLGQKLGEALDSITAPYPVINKDKCNKCGQCVTACKENAIFQSPGQYPQVFENLCSSCGACWTICPRGAISQKEKEVGRIYQNKISDNYQLITGEANGGLEETGPVVLAVKKFALKMAKQENYQVVVLDTAAGLHCPVISALIGVDRAYLVTEPTPLGIHDMKLMIDLTKKLKLKVEIIINQADLGEVKEIEEVADRKKIKIKAKLPYSKKIVKAYSQGRLNRLKVGGIR